jgi:hypothetical protein
LDANAGQPCKPHPIGACLPGKSHAECAGTRGVAWVPGNPAAIDVSTVAHAHHAHGAIGIVYRVNHPVSALSGAEETLNRRRQRFAHTVRPVKQGAGDEFVHRQAADPWKYPGGGALSLPVPARIQPEAIACTAPSRSHMGESGTQDGGPPSPFQSKSEPDPRGTRWCAYDRTRDSPGHQGPWRSLGDLFEGLAKIEAQFQSGE